MKHYAFPTINHYDDVRFAVDGCDEIKLMDRDGFKVVDYLYNTPETFPVIPDDVNSDEYKLAVMRRECRGLLFNNDGSILTRRLHKFFNMGERTETLAENIDFSQDHHVLNKEDGSMLSPYMDPEEHIKWAFESNRSYTQRVFWGTMFGWTDVAQQAETYIRESNLNYEGFARECISAGWVPIFEWCSPASRVVLRHDKPHMVLLSIRHVVTGAYKTYEEMCEWGNRYALQTVHSFGRVDGDPAEFMERTHGLINTEGFVVQFFNGHATKIKTSWYLRFHNAKENLVWEKDVWNLILAGDVDDVIPILMDHDKVRIETFQHEFWEAIEAATRILEDETETMMLSAGDDRAAFAAMVKANTVLPRPMHGMAFQMFTGKADASTLIRQYAAKSVGTGTKIDDARKIIQVKPW